MKIDDFLKGFPDLWRVCSYIPQLERKSGKPSTDWLSKGLEEWCDYLEKNQAKLGFWNPDFRKVQYDKEEKDSLLSHVDAELGESEAKKRLMELKRWFERLEDELDEPMDSNLKNDLFFGFLVMFKFRKEGMRLKEALAIGEDSRQQMKFYEQLQELAKNVPKADVRPWRREWQRRFLNLIEEWNKVTDVEVISRARTLPIIKELKFCLMRDSRDLQKAHVDEFLTIAGTHIRTTIKLQRKQGLLDGCYSIKQV